MLGPDHDEFVGVLDRALIRRKDGISYEVDRRHAELIIQQLKFDEARSVVTPGTSE